MRQAKALCDNTMTNRELMDKIGGEEGTVEKAEQWLALLQAQDPYFWQSDQMLNLEEIVHRRRRSATILAGMDAPPSPAQIAGLLDSIDYSKAETGDDIDEMDAREHVIGQIFPHPDSRRYLDSLTAESAITTEEAVRAALSYQPKATFNLPGPVTEDWRSEQTEG